MDISKAQNRITEYSYLRVLGTLFVIIGHAAAMGYLPDAADFAPGEAGYTGTAGRLITQASAYLYTFHMPLFFALSGAVTRASRAVERPFADFFTSRFKRLMLPYFGFLFLWSLPIKAACGIFTGTQFAQIVMNSALTTGDSGYLWFLYKLFTVSMLFWIFARTVLERHRRAGLIALGAAALLGLGVPTTLFIGVEMKYFLFFALGWLFDEIRPRFTRWVRSHRVVTLSAFAVYFVLFYFFNIAVTPSLSSANLYLIQTFERAYGMLSSAISTLAWFALCCVLSGLTRAPESAVSYLDSRSMGVYLFHDPLNYIVDALYLSAVSAGAAVVSSGMSAAIFTLKLALGIGGSLLLAALWRKAARHRAARIAVAAVCLLVFCASVGYIYIANIY